jgi:diazepam-binding inhibitor (GABA receptor modulating acyl-CoA-binding protein)
VNINKKIIYELINKAKQNKMNDIENNFIYASETIKKTPENKKISDERKLEYYSLYKQATIGPCNTDKPWAINVVESAKWNAWNNLNKMSKKDAMIKYCKLFIEDIKN